MELVFCCTFWLFELILAFVVIFDYLKKFFREGQRLNFFQDRNKIFDGFSEDFSRQRLNKFTAILKLYHYLLF